MINNWIFFYTTDKGVFLFGNYYCIKPKKTQINKELEAFVLTREDIDSWGYSIEKEIQRRKINDIKHETLGI